MTSDSLLKVIEHQNPDIVSRFRTLCTKMSDDVYRINEFHSMFQKKFGNTEMDAMKKLLFVACIMKIFSPASLYAKGIFSSGLKSGLTGPLKVTSKRSVCHWTEQARNYYSVLKVRSFIADVDRISLELMEG